VKFPLAMDSPISVFGQVASEFILNAPTAYADGTELTKSLILDMTIFLEEFAPPAGLSGIISKETVPAIVRFILMVFSIEFLETTEQTAVPNNDQKDNEASPRVSMSSEADPEQLPRTPPRSPLSPKVSGENFQMQNFPDSAKDQAPHEQSIPVIRPAKDYFDGLWTSGYRDVVIEQLKIEVYSAGFTNYPLLLPDRL
jgi:hypothetical protein